MTPVVSCQSTCWILLSNPRCGKYPCKSETGRVQAQKAFTINLSHVHTQAHTQAHTQTLVSLLLSSDTQPRQHLKHSQRDEKKQFIIASAASVFTHTNISLGLIVCWYSFAFELLFQANEISCWKTFTQRDDSVVILHRLEWPEHSAPVYVSFCKWL